MGPPLEDLNVTPEEKHQNISAQLKQSSEAKRALIVKVSHVGGHRYAGNCIVSTFQFVKLSSLFFLDSPWADPKISIFTPFPGPLAG